MQSYLPQWRHRSRDLAGKFPELLSSWRNVGSYVKSKSGVNAYNGPRRT
jgi:hypothetical protein